MKRAIVLGLAMVIVMGIWGCGKEEAQVVDYVEIAPKQSEPLILIPENYEEETQESMQTQSQEEVTAFADLKDTVYEIRDGFFEDGVKKIEYPVVVGMADEGLQQKINQNIENIVKHVEQIEGLSSYNIEYKIATKGTGILSLVFEGNYNGTNQAYPVNFVKTLNIDMTTGDNLRLKDYADMAMIVSGLEQDYGYEVMSENVEKADFSMFLNNGYMTDYAMMLLDFDADFKNPDMKPTGYSCIKDNHLVMFMETEHAMGDYVEIQFSAALTGNR